MKKFGGKKHILVEFTFIHASIIVCHIQTRGTEIALQFIFSVNIFALNLPVNSVSQHLMCKALCLMGGTFIYLFIPIIILLIEMFRFVILFFQRKKM
jgi:hypothetical protein